MGWVVNKKYPHAGTVNSGNSLEAGSSLINHSVKGKVTDDNGKPLEGVNIMISGTNTGTTTNNRGDYQLNDVPVNAILIFRYIGYVTQTIQAGNKTLLDVMLESNTTGLGEVVVVGYGTQRKANLTGAVTQVKGDIVQNRPVANVGQALQGVAPGLNINLTGDPGGPGTPASFNIRGTGSLNGGSPLLIVDGVPVDDLQSINPNDIAAVTVLKDAAASAIYGARAAYGVIMITTRGGEKNTKMTLSYNLMLANSTYTRIPEMGNSLEYATTSNQAAINSGVAPPFGQAQIDRIKEYMANPGSIPVTIPNPTNPNRWDWVNANANNDWYKVYLKPWALNQTHNLTLTGGSKTTTYYVSGGYYKQGGLLRFGNDQYDRFNVTNNIHAEPTPWMRMNFRMRFNNSKINTPYTFSNLEGNWFHLASSRWPTWPVINPDGLYSHISKVPDFLSGARSISSVKDLLLSGAVEMEPVKNWKINIDYSYNDQTAKASDHDAFVYAYALDGTKYSIGDPQNSISERVSTNNYKSANLYSSYEKELGRHRVKVLIGEQIEEGNRYVLAGKRTDLITDEIPSMGVATGDQFVSDSISDWATIGTFARINYSFADKYLLELNGRYDGSSRFPRKNRFGLFPSISAGWNIARENFWQPLKNSVNELKIRGSYGSLGNQDVANYLYLSTIGIGTNLPYIIDNKRPNYLQSPGLVSANITWETVKVFDLGLDAAFLDNKLSFSYDWYIRNTLNMLGPPQALPATLGAAIPKENNANLQTKGFELSVGWKDKIGKDFRYNVSFVLSNYETVVKKYLNPTGILSTYYEGQKIGEIWGYETAGLIQTDKEAETMNELTSGSTNFYKKWSIGDVMYKDISGDGALNNGDNTLNNHGDLKVIGNQTPRFPFGLNMGFNWKGLDFSMFWQGVAQRDLWLSGVNFWGYPSIWKSILDYWTPENTDAYWPKPYSTSEKAKNQYVQSRYLQSGAYVRLKNLQIGYNVPQSILDRTKFQKIRIFLTGENLLTSSKIDKNFDPEVVGGSWGSGKEYPLMKTISFGVNLSL